MNNPFTSAFLVLLLTSLPLAVAEARDLLSIPRTATNGFRLEVSLAPHATSSDWGKFRLLAGDELLFGDGTANAGPGIFIEGYRVADKLSSISVLEEATGAQWEYARLDLTSAYTNRLTRFHRHLLFVQPDLFVVYDDIEAKEPDEFAIFVNSPFEMEFAPKARDFRMEMPKAGFVAHLLLADRNMFERWQALNSTDAACSRAFQLTSTNKLHEVRLITAMRPHLPGQRQDTGFKLLQSTTAIGARIWRSGLPTLIAFRTAAKGSEADLTGLPVPGSVAVDVFDPKPRSRRAQPKETGK
jgi:hypothetical protein